MSNVDQWCEPDGCPASICGGPHREVETSLGTEILRADQEPIGTVLPASDDAAPKTLVLKWAYRYFSLEVEHFDSEDDAIRAAGWASDASEEALRCIEVWDAHGHRVIDAEDVFRRAEAMQEQESKAHGPVPPIVANVLITSLDGKDAVYSSHTNAPEAEDERVRLRAFVGDRVRVERAR